jgi:hypothetical protein
VTWLASNWGNLASVLGLGLSVWVLVVSTQAKAAAEGAKRALELRTLAMALRSCGDEMASLAQHVESQAWQYGDTVAGHLLRELSYITTRWVEHLDAKSAEGLALASSHVEKVRGQLRKARARALREPELLALHRSVERIEMLLAAEIGKSESRMDVIATDKGNRS